MSKSKNVGYVFRDKKAKTVYPVERTAPDVLRSFVPQEKPKTLQELIDECFMVPGPGRVVVMPDKLIFKTDRIIVSTPKQQLGTTAIILKVGDNCGLTFGGRPLKVGDRVAYGTWTGTQFSFENRPSYRILDQTEIASVLVGKATKLLEVEA